MNRNESYREKNRGPAYVPKFVTPTGGNLMYFEILLCLDLISQQNVELDLMLRKTLSLAIQCSSSEVINH